jgi:hypothetical protein
LFTVTTLLISSALMGAIGTQSRGPDPMKTQLQQTLRESGSGDAFTATMGYLPAWANAPSLALAVLGGVALVADSDYARSSTLPLVQSVRRNPLVRAARRYSSPWVVGFLALMAVAHFVFSSTKILHHAGHAFKHVEGAAATTVLPLLLLALPTTPVEASLHGPALLLAGFVPALTWQSALFISGMLLALVAVMVVRMALEILIWLSPIPFVDFVFQTAKHIFTIGLMGLYFVSPVAAAVVAGIVVAISLLLLPWAVRWVRFAYLVVANPLLSMAAPRFRPRLVEVRRLPSDIIDAKLACRGAALKARGFKKRASVLVVRAGEHRLLLGRRYFRRKQRGLAGVGERVVIGRGLIWVELRVLDTNGEVLDRVAFSRALAPQIATMCTILEAEDAGSLTRMPAWVRRLFWPEEPVVQQLDHPA